MRSFLEIARTPTPRSRETRLDDYMDSGTRREMKIQVGMIDAMTMDAAKFGQLAKLKGCRSEQ